MLMIILSSLEAAEWKRMSPTLTGQILSMLSSSAAKESSERITFHANCQLYWLCDGASRHLPVGENKFESHCCLESLNDHID